MFELFLLAVGKSEFVKLFKLKPCEILVIAVLLDKFFCVVQSF